MTYATEQSVLNTQWNAAHASEMAAFEQMRPFMTLKPKIYPDGTQWCALYGENIQEGVAGFGETPEQAAIDFDRRWKGQPCKHENAGEVGGEAGDRYCPNCQKYVEPLPVATDEDGENHDES
jgi:hypothetical protein